MITDIFDLKSDAEQEVYQLIDKKYRKLPRTKDGSINFAASGFQDNDVDALRHAYVSGVYAQEFGSITAELLGTIYEFFPGHGTSSPNNERSMNMDLWNNAVGRKYGKKLKGREELFDALINALKNRELITNPEDTREYSGLPLRSATQTTRGTVVVIGKDKKRRNILFYDLHEKTIMSRLDFVSLIRAGKYSRYCVRFSNGQSIPVARRDSSILNNLGLI
jgi:hypothetical protein